MSEESNQGSGDDESNRKQGEESESSEDQFQFEEEDEVDEEELKRYEKIVLDRVNKATKNQFKDLDGLTKTLSQKAEEFRKKGVELKEKEKQGDESGGNQTQKTTQKPETVSPVIKSIYFNQNPEIQFVWDEVVATAKKLGQDPFELAEDPYFKGKAKMKSEEHKQNEENKQKVTPPTKGMGSVKKDWSKLTAKEVDELPLDQFEEYSNAMAKNAASSR